MKKKLIYVGLILGLMVLFLIIGSNNANAQIFDGDNFSIDIPLNNYYVEGWYPDDAGALYVMKNDENSGIFIDTRINRENVVYTEEYIKEKLNIDSNTPLGDGIVDFEILKIDGCQGYRIVYDIYGDGAWYRCYYATASDNYEYQIEISLSNNLDYLSSKEAQDIIKSFKIKDTITNSNGIPFTDVGINDWSYWAVKYAYENKMMSGLNKYTFAPDNTLTRGMLVTILHNMEGQPYQPGISKFPDVQDTTSYYYVAVKWATENKIISGYENGNFGPNDPITREQLAVILNQYCIYKGKYKSVIADYSKFKDSDKISDFATWGMNWAVGSGIINGSNGYLNPQGTATRAEAAAMLHNYCLKFN